MSGGNREYVFEFRSSTATTQSFSTDYKNVNYVFDMISKLGDENIEYTVSKTGTVPTSISKKLTANTITFSFNENTTTSNKTGQVTLTQNGSGKQIIINVTQTTNPYTFTFTDSGPYGNNYISPCTGATNTFAVTSKKNSSNTGFTVVSYPSFVSSVSTSSTGVTVTSNQSRSTSKKSGTLKLQQNGSNQTITKTIYQYGGVIHTKDSPITYTLPINAAAYTANTAAFVWESSGNGFSCTDVFKPYVYSTSSGITSTTFVLNSSYNDYRRYSVTVGFKPNSNEHTETMTLANTTYSPAALLIYKFFFH